MTPDKSTAKAFPNYTSGRIVADSELLNWPGIFVRRLRFPRQVDRFLVPATPEPLFSCVLSGTAAFRERDAGQDWIERQLTPGDLFVTHSKEPYELTWSSPAGKEIDTIVMHFAVDRFLSVLDQLFPGKREEIEVIDFFGRDEVATPLFHALAGMLEQRVPGSSPRVSAIGALMTAHLLEKYTHAAAAKPDYLGGLPIGKLRKLEAFVGESLNEEVSLDAMASVVELSPFHFSRVFKQTTGMTPLQFVTRERIARAQQLMRETSRSLIEIGMDVGYTSPSHFAQVFRRQVGVTPTEFRREL
ncbi:AraC family transcriptional regulator [Luteolibacter soli]|uniref:AraC family transcriptional regulator n=1 Tax=Luteolibacter soli TaxID=3135280 RepID=A0ABU9APP5_9BACT